MAQQGCLPDSFPQQKILKNGQYIPGIPQASDQDLARTARVEASSTYQLKSLAANGEWQSLSDQRAMMIPMTEGQIPACSPQFRAARDITLDISLRKSEVTTNYRVFAESIH